MTLALPERVLAALVACPQGTATAELDPGAADAIAALRRRGHSIAVDDGRVRLACAAHHFDPARFEAARRSALGSALEVWEEAPSTNDLARASAATAAAGQAWLAESQSHGRGRQGRTWTCAPHAGLLVSFIVRTPLETVAHPTWLPLAIGLGAAEALRRATGADVRTKWPNDLWFGGRKLGGILVEAWPGTHAHAVAGIGINCSADAFAGAVLPHAAALPRTVAREILLAELLYGVESRLADWSGGRADELASAWVATDCVLGSRVRVERTGEIVHGRAAAITEAGLLRVELDDGGLRDLAAGEVHLA